MNNEQHKVKILKMEPLTHDVMRFTLEKPNGYEFQPGQATEICINKPDWNEERRPFTFTSLNKDNDLEFTIKIYNDHNGVTQQLGKCQVGDELILHDVWGTILYDKPGVFIAGGAGVTPFIAILRDLADKNELANNKLLFANKTTKDIILQNEFEAMLGQNFINILSNEQNNNYAHGQIDEAFLNEHLQNKDCKVYLCGPEPMMEAIDKMLQKIGVPAENIVTEKF